MFTKPTLQAEVTNDFQDDHDRKYRTDIGVEIIADMTNTSVLICESLELCDSMSTLGWSVSGLLSALDDTNYTCNPYIIRMSSAQL